jgi:hypothetical protein
MNEELQIEAMARVDGWKVCSWNGQLYKGLLYATNLNLPDYLHDDNEIDRMVRETINKEPSLYPKYLTALEQVTRRDNTFMLCATTAQKVEAYLKAKGLWTKEME